MNISLKKTIAQLDRCLQDGGETDIVRLHRMYKLALRLQSQLLSVIYDMETFDGNDTEKCLAQEQINGRNNGTSVTLIINEPLPSMKRLTEAVEEHWKAMLHAAIEEAARQEPLLYFDKAMVEIEIVTPRGSDNARLWDTSNRAINVIINNLKGIFFEDDNMEHMAFSGSGGGEKKVPQLSVFWTLTNHGKSEASHERRFLGKTMRLENCHGE